MRLTGKLLRKAVLICLGGCVISAGGFVISDLMLEVRAAETTSRTTEEIGTTAAVNQEAAGQSSTAPVYQLGEFVVTATKTAEPVSTVPASVDVLTRQQIEERHIDSVAQTLQYLPGVYMSQAAEGGIMMRGFDSTNMLVMLNGQPLNSAWDGSVDWNQIPTNSIEKIEVVRGAGSSLYGGQAVGGTINIVTRDADQPLSGTVTLSAGSNSTYQQALQVQGKADEHWFFSGGYEKKQSNGWTGYYRAIAPNSRRQNAAYEADLKRLSGGSYVVGGRGRKAWKSDNYNFEVGYAFDENRKLAYDYLHTKYSYRYNNPFSYVQDEDGNMVFRGVVRTQDGNTVTLSPYRFLGYVGKREREMHNLRYSDTKNQIAAHFSFSNYFVNGYTSPASSATLTSGAGGLSSYPSKSYDFDLTKTWNVGKHTIVGGISGKWDSFDQTRYNLTDWRNWNSKINAYEFHGGKDENYAVYVQDKIQHNDKWTTYWGLRFDYYKKYDGYSRILTSGLDAHHASGSFTEISPKLVVEYAPTADSTVYASYGHSFNPPILYKVYRQSGMIGDASPVLANPGLRPETSDTFELGYKKQFGQKTRMGISAYYIKTDDTILYTRHYNAAGQLLFNRYDNAGESNRHGLELTASHDFTKSLTGYLNYAWEKGTVRENGVKRDNYDFPRHILHMGVNYHRDRWTGVLDAQYVSARQAPDSATGEFNSYDPFFVVNAAVTYKLREDWDLQFGVNNILNRQFYDDEAASGRTYSVTTRYNF